MTAEDTDKEHAATGKRLAELRRKGSVMRSRDLSGSLVIIVAVIQLLFFSSYIEQTWSQNFISCSEAVKQILTNPDHFEGFLKTLLMNNAMTIFPFFLIMFLSAFISPFLFGQWNFTLEVIQFKFEKLNPITNLKNIFSPSRAMLEIVKSMIKAFLILGMMVYYFILHRVDMITLMNTAPERAIHGSYALVAEFIFYLSCSLIFLVLLDIGIQYFQFQKQNKMSTQEIKDEHKETEGSMETKRRIRTAQFEILKQRVTQTVPKANVIIVNPTHYSVALKYEEKKDRAPKVIAKGKAALAHQIKSLAISNAIPIYEAPTLARAIYYTSNVGSEVHPNLYMSVAIVLSYIYQLKRYQHGLGQLPQKVDDLRIPKEFIFNE